jgi:gamma-glutamyl phosphate reductase
MKILSNLNCHELVLDEWSRLRDIRLRSLVENPEAFGASHEVLSKFSESEWRNEFKELTHLVAVIDSVDISIMTIEILD